VNKGEQMEPIIANAYAEHKGGVAYSPGSMIRKGNKTSSDLKFCNKADFTYEGSAGRFNVSVKSFGVGISPANLLNASGTFLVGVPILNAELLADDYEENRTRLNKGLFQIDHSVPFILRSRNKLIETLGSKDNAKAYIDFVRHYLQCKHRVLSDYVECSKTAEIDGLMRFLIYGRDTDQLCISDGTRFLIFYKETESYKALYPYITFDAPSAKRNSSYLAHQKQDNQYLSFVLSLRLSMSQKNARAIRGLADESFRIRGSGGINRQ
jgi:hypothetical protein